MKLFTLCLSFAMLSSTQVLANNEDQISTNKLCYEYGENVEARFIYTHQQVGDFVGLYNSNADTNNLGETPLWYLLPSGEQYDSIVFGTGVQAQKNKLDDSWPLPAGAYKAVMARDTPEGIYIAFAESANVIVKPKGQSCHGENDPAPGLRGSS